MNLSLSPGRTRAGHLLRRGLVAVALAAVAGSTLGSPASAATGDAGLYGAQDPTYDGVFRQSLALMGLAAQGIAPPASAVDWLVRQQCADGSFQAYRADVSVPCAPSDPATYTGPDSNSTALAAVALFQSGRTAAARRATTWLTGLQGPDGGFAYYKGGAPDASSTGLALLALQTVAPQDRSARVPNGVRYLGTLRQSCASGGGLAYQAGQAAGTFSSAQGLLGLSRPLPVAPVGRLAANPRCGSEVRTNVGAYLADAIMESGAIPSAFGSGPDLTSTGFAVIGLAASGVGRAAVARGTRALVAGTPTYARVDGQAVPGAIGVLLMVAEATGRDPRAFGGVNLVSALAGSLRR
jgi:hypothetical protein